MTTIESDSTATPELMICWLGGALRSFLKNPIFAYDILGNRRMVPDFSSLAVARLPPTAGGSVCGHNRLAGPHMRRNLARFRRIVCPPFFVIIPLLTS